MFYGGGWNCRHRWVPVSPGKIDVEKGAKPDKSEHAAMKVLEIHGHCGTFKKASGIGRAHDLELDGMKAEIKTLTNKTQDGGEAERIRQHLRNAKKQDAEWAILNVEKEVGDEIISKGINAYMRRHKGLSKISIINKGKINTKDYKNE
ncbi:MAG: hypothetical protein ACLFR2_06730 [Candidatus Kapaibacterium sp.]